MGAGLEFEEAAAPVKDDLLEAVGLLMQRAQAVGAVRSDVTADTVVSLVVGDVSGRLAHADSCPDDMVGIVCDGLRRHLD